MLEYFFKYIILIIGILSVSVAEQENTWQSWQIQQAPQRVQYVSSWDQQDIKQPNLPTNPQLSNPIDRPRHDQFNAIPIHQTDSQTVDNWHNKQLYASQERYRNHQNNIDIERQPLRPEAEHSVSIDTWLNRQPSQSYDNKNLHRLKPHDEKPQPQEPYYQHYEHQYPNPQLPEFNHDYRAQSNQPQKPGYVNYEQQSPNPPRNPSYPLPYQDDRTQAIWPHEPNYLTYEQQSQNLPSRPSYQHHDYQTSPHHKQPLENPPQNAPNRLPGKPETPNKTKPQSPQAPRNNKPNQDYHTHTNNQPDIEDYVIVPGIVDARCPRTDNPRKPVHFPMSGNCRKFLMCASGRAYPMDCPGDLEFSAKKNRCEFPEEAQCSTQ